jgi:hypothetical protein
MFGEYDNVRIVKLLKNDRPYTGSKSVSRPPKIGDEGAIVHVLEVGKAFIVENVAANGYTVWLADFVAEELEPA